MLVKCCIDIWIDQDYFYVSDKRIQDWMDKMSMNGVSNNPCTEKGVKVAPACQSYNGIKLQQKYNQSYCMAIHYVEQFVHWM